MVTNWERLVQRSQTKRPVNQTLRVKIMTEPKVGWHQVQPMVCPTPPRSDASALPPTLSCHFRAASGIAPDTPGSPRSYTSTSETHTCHLWVKRVCCGWCPEVVQGGGAEPLNFKLKEFDSPDFGSVLHPTLVHRILSQCFEPKQDSLFNPSLLYLT